ncbi:MAG: hypothetical protein AB1425_16650, partial [Actinomycetota bacterium]
MTETYENRPRTGEAYEPLASAKLTDRDGSSARLKSGSTTVEITALAPDLFRVGAFPNGRLPDYRSEAIAKEEWEPVEV